LFIVQTSVVWNVVKYRHVQNIHNNLLHIHTWFHTHCFRFYILGHEQNDLGRFALVQ
jgi:hypothetical protein